MEKTRRKRKVEDSNRTRVDENKIRKIRTQKKDERVRRIIKWTTCVKWREEEKEEKRKKDNTEAATGHVDHNRIGRWKHKGNNTCGVTD